MIVCTETVFTLHTTHTSYQLAVAPNGMVLHTYYGTRLPEDVPSLADARMPHSDPGCWPDLLPQELSGCGTADNRTPAVIPEYADGTEAAAFVFDHAVVTPGTPQLPGLPMFRTGEGVETLSVFLKDAGGLVVELRYSVYEAEDLVTRTAVYTNAGTQPLTLHKAASLSVDLAPDALELITLNGTCCTLFDQHGECRDQHTVKDTCLALCKSVIMGSNHAEMFVFYPFLECNNVFCHIPYFFDCAAAFDVESIKNILCFCTDCFFICNIISDCPHFSQSNCLVYRNILLYRFVSSM